MGFFDRLFGGKKERKERKERLPQEREPLGQPFAPEAYPFDGEVRIFHQDYKRLTTGWWKVSVASAEEWLVKIEDMQTALRQHFGKFQMQDGRLVPRWSEATWQLVRKRLRVGRK